MPIHFAVLINFVSFQLFGNLKVEFSKTKQNLVSYCQCSPIAVTNLKRTYLNKLKPGTEEGACLQKNNPPASSIIISTLSTDYRAYRLREDSSVKKVALCIDSNTGSIFFSRDIVAQRTNLRGGRVRAGRRV